MRFAVVQGTVTLSQCHPSFQGATLKLATPVQGAELVPPQPSYDDALVVWDDLGAGIGDLIAISEGAEAAQPFQPHVKPVDTYGAALIDNVSL